MANVRRIKIGNTTYNIKDNSARTSITNVDENTRANASENRAVGDLLWLNSKLYKVISNISKGALYIISGTGQNLEEVTIEDLLYTDKINIVTPEMFGAVGDGVTNDTDSIIEAVMTDKPVIFSPNKIYAMNNNNLITGIDSMVLYGNGSKIVVPSEKTTSNTFKCEGVSNIMICDLNIETVANKPDASIYERPSGNNYSNVTFLKADTFTECVLDNIETNYLEGLAKLEDEVATVTDMVTISNCRGYNCNYFVFGKHIKTVNVTNCIAQHVHSSRLDHSLYFSTDIRYCNIESVVSDNCVGSGINLYGVSGYEESAKNYAISDCKILNGTNGGIYVMGGSGTISNCIISLPTNNNSLPIRNKGSNMQVNNCKIAGGFAVLSEYSNIDHVTPYTSFIGCLLDVNILESNQYAASVAGTRKYMNCDILIRVSGAADLIIADTTSAEYDINNCYFHRASSYNYNLIKATAACKAKIGFNYFERRGTLFDGDDSAVVGVGNVCYATCATNHGTYAGNTTGFTT